MGCHWVTSWDINYQFLWQRKVLLEVIAVVTVLRKAVRMIRSVAGVALDLNVRISQITVQGRSQLAHVQAIVPCMHSVVLVYPLAGHTVVGVYRTADAIQ